MATRLTRRTDGKLQTPSGALVDADLFDPITSSEPDMFDDIDIDQAFDEWEKLNNGNSNDNRIDPPSSPPRQPLTDRSNICESVIKEKDFFSLKKEKSPQKALKFSSNIETFSQQFVRPPTPAKFIPNVKDEVKEEGQLVEKEEEEDGQRSGRTAAALALERIDFFNSASAAQSDIKNDPDKKELIKDEPIGPQELEELETMASKRKRKSKTPQYIKDDMAEFQDSIKLTQEMEEKNNVENDATKVPTICLSEEQTKVLEMVVEGKKNVFFTGAAGTGKSVLLKEIIKQLREKHESANRAVTDVAETGRKVTRVAVCASTGLAACHIGGVTLHSFAGIGLGKENVDALLKKIRKNRKSLNRWRNIKVLVLDEVSMVDGVLFDKLNEIGKSLRRNERPFGGIQLVITGDFYQLPPVPDKDSSSSNNNEQLSKFVFEADSWEQAIPATVELRRVFRQKDSSFSSMLNELRQGIVSQDSNEILKNQTKEVIPAEGMSATELFPRKIDVDRANNERLRRLTTKPFIYNCEDWREDSFNGKNAKLDNLMCVEKLTVKLGAQVMMVKNIDETLVNGTIGTVVGFMSESSFSMLDCNRLSGLSNTKLMNFVDQFKEHLKKSIDKELEEQQTIYGVKPNDPSKMSAALRRKHATLEKLQSNSENIGQLYPLVRYAIPNGTFRIQLAHPEEWKVEDIDGRVIAKRTQVPLILAWALSIHKAQGQTLPYVKVDLSRAFETGQSYVALSRAISLEGLQVLGFSRERVMVDDKVVEFYQNLKSVEEHKNGEEDDGDDSEPVKKKKKKTRQTRNGDQSLLDFFK